MKMSLLFLLLVGTPGAVWGQVPFTSGTHQVKNLTASALSYDAGKGVYEPYSSAVLRQENTAAPKKTPLKAALLSGLLPGAGQWYSGEKLKAVMFAAGEVSLWLFRSHFRNNGAEIERDFRTFADENWSLTEYVNWKETVDITRYSHVLPQTKSQQYYEMIGKYDQFLAGWPDSAGDPDPSDFRLQYMRSQFKSNKEYKRADLMAQLLVLNRVASAVESALSVHRRNANVSLALRWRYSRADEKTIPMVKIRYAW